MGPRDRRRGATRRGRSRGGCGCSLLVVVLLAGLLVVAEFGARWYLSDQAEREASAQLGAPVSVEFSGTPLLWDLLSRQHVSSVHLTSPGSATVPRIDVTGHSVTRVDGGIRADSADGTATLDPDQLTAAAARGNSTEDTPLEGLAEIRSVRPDPPSGLLLADVGGIAEIGVAPSVVDGQLALTPQHTSLLGFELPGGLFSGITATVDDTMAALPEGVTIEDARVVEGGLEVGLEGRDVVLR